MLCSPLPGIPSALLLVFALLLTSPARVQCNEDDGGGKIEKILNAMKSLGAALPTNDAEYPTCGDCFCIPGDGEECPYEDMPETDFAKIIPTLRRFQLKNPISLPCDPFQEEDCETSPPLQEGGACVAELVRPDGRLSSRLECPNQWSYNLTTYRGTVQEAQEKGLLVTHELACGVCSSFQDLAVYMEQGPELANLAQVCGLRGLRSASAGIQCFLDAGFTSDCAAIWFYNTQFSGDVCFDICIEYYLRGEPDNEPPPDCQLAECLECDDTLAGPIFNLYAGRTRRRSGLLSGIVRPCDEISSLQQEDPCLYA